MKYAIFGDIHANLEALQAVMADAEQQGCTDYVCTGDIVGYASDPNECLRIVREMGCPVVKGNHDEESTLSTSLEGLNPLAKQAMEWTRAQLNEDEQDFLKNMKLVRQVADFTIVHATLDTPGSWTYVTNKFDAMASFSYQFTQLCFYGHTHTPRIYVKSDSVEPLEETEVNLEMGRKYFINVGSTGQPRDGDWRASYVVYDSDNQNVTIRRIDYDIQKAQDKIIEAGLPEMLAHRLTLGK
ncbi:MAG: metallophosphatase family protein [Verrucomicrobiales bacterium]|nr:metallophosphatase family protein [Verrucomicrobiales bacterium]|tara:strand:- start:34861 stop:35583 length:723 start_codon:yes stop_codon:yes gene_type:complete